MKGFAVSAPGKLVLSGEYAVLDGAPALAIAINRRAKVSVQISNDNYHSIDSPGYEQGRFRADGGDLQFSAGGQSYDLFESAWAVTSPKIAENCAFTLNTSEFVDLATGVKLGLGSSAALSVALCAALLPADTSAVDVAAAAQQAHRHFQGGVGSGIDIATSCYGGVVRYCMHGQVAQQMHWPDGLEYALLWSGVPTSTKDKLLQFRGQPHRKSRTSLAEAAKRVARAWNLSSDSDLISEFGIYIEALKCFSIDYKLGVFDAGHATLENTASRFDVMYKPCGAGGGDVGVVMGTDAAAVAAFVENATYLGFRYLDASVDYQGVTLGGAES